MSGKSHNIQDKLIKIFSENEYRNNIKNAYLDDIFGMHSKHLGPLNHDKVIYLINNENKYLGFFAAYRLVLESLFFADRTGMTPVVKYGKGFAYREDKGKMAGINPFEYYFQQVSEVTFKDAKKSAKVVRGTRTHNNMVQLILTGSYGRYDFNDEYVDLMSQIHKKYIHLNNHTQRYINCGLSIIPTGEKVLGVHVRGSDYKRHYNIHPVRVKEEEYVTEIIKCLDKGGYNKIFLATDDLNSLHYMQRIFGDKLLFYDDVSRTTGQQSVAFSDSTRNNHHYKLGLEVLRDAYTLASCDGLISGVSQVSLCARIIKNSKYEYLRICDKGVYHNGINFKLKK